MTEKSRYSDLRLRLMSAAAALALGLGALWFGGWVLNVILIICAGLMAWELGQMHAPQAVVSVSFGAILAAVVFAVLYLPLGILLALSALIVLAIWKYFNSDWFVLAIGSLVIVLAMIALHDFRLNQGLAFTLWLIFCVIASDVGGYFAGKTFGGPKLWPRVSPNKTWSGTLGGWALAAGVGVIAIICGIGGWIILPLSILVAIAAQIGDLLESAMKRRAGIKDSSQLIPGHGGLLDRFDGLLGASCFLFLLGAAGALPVSGGV